MEENYYADRVRLRQLLQRQEQMTTRELMAEIGRSRSWVKKWRQRLRDAPTKDEAVLRSQSRAPNRRRPAIAAEVVECILAIRDTPPGQLQRIPGPKTILYYLQQNTALRVQYEVPRAPSTIWRILDKHGRIARKARRVHEPLERPAPMVHWQLDFKDISTVKPDPDGDGKQQHVVEALNLVDAGTSTLLAFRLHTAFTTETALAAVAECLREQGVPAQVTFDRDARFVGSASADGFPAAWQRLWHALGVQVDLCPPQRPDRNAFVERYHRAYQEECLAVQRPADLEQAELVTTHFQQHYNFERPHQGLACGNRPPRVAFPNLPQRPPLPSVVDPDAWLRVIDGRVYTRRITHNGTIRVANQRYYIRRTLRGQHVTVQVDALTGRFIIRHGGHLLKQVPIRGVHRRQMAFDDYLTLLCQEARQEARQRSISQGVTMS